MRSFKRPGYMTGDYHAAELHLFRMFDKNILFNVDTMLFYEVLPVVYDIAALLSDPGHPDPTSSLKSRYPEADIQEAVAYLMKEGFLREGHAVAANNRPKLIKRSGIRHLELMVTHACNMRCRYCYGSLSADGWEDAPHLYGASHSGMSLETAVKGVDYLFAASGRLKDLSVIFFGGEPFLELPLMEEVAAYVRKKEAETGKKADLSLSTNALLLNNQRAIDFLMKYKVGCQISIDGPPVIHDQTRCLPGGIGSYSAILPGIKKLISKRRGRVPARATICHDRVDLPSILEHLLSLGFGSVHLEPARGSSGALMVTPDDVPAIKEQNEAIALFLVKRVRENRFFNYSNLVKYIRQTRVVRERLAHYCGAGRTYFALSQDGAFYPCHRFVGLDDYRMGDIETGMDLGLQRKILDLTVDNRPVCRECWARYLCGGGCWKHAVDAHGRLEEPDEEVSCQLTRHLIECAMAINSELGVADKDILSDMYEKATEPYLVTEKEGDHERGKDTGAETAGVPGMAV